MPYIWDRTVWNYTPLAGLLRHLRLLLMITLLVHFIPVVRQVLERNHLGYTLVIALLVTLVAGILISTVDPGIKSIEEGIWYAWVTLATVGYGDVVPKSTAGRVIGGVLIFLGLVFFSLITANIAAFLVRRDVEKAERKEGELAHRVKDLQAQLERIERLFERHGLSEIETNKSTLCATHETGARDGDRRLRSGDYTEVRHHSLPSSLSVGIGWHAPVRTRYGVRLPVGMMRLRPFGLCALLFLQGL
jgi:ion channel